MTGEKQRRRFQLIRRCEWSLRTGVLVCSFGIAAFGFYWYHWGDGTPALPEGSLIVNVNTATREQIDTVPGIGPIGAMQIISNRPYATVDQLERVHGIVPHQVDEMRPYIKVNGLTEPKY